MPLGNGNDVQAKAGNEANTAISYGPGTWKHHD